MQGLRFGAFLVVELAQVLIFSKMQQPRGEEVPSMITPNHRLLHQCTREADPLAVIVGIIGQGPEYS